MNVLSLPDEMLASVLKYTRFEDLTEFRKVSSKIDSVARRYGLHKWKTHNLTISYDKTEVKLLILLVPKVSKLFIWPPSTDLLDVLKYIFPKIRGVKQLCIYNDLNTTNNIISNEVGEFLLGNECKNITRLDVVGWDISINFNTMRNIMTKLKLKDLYIRSSFTEFEFSDAVIEGIPFVCLMLTNKMGDCMKLSLPYVASLCTLKIPSRFICEIKNSTVADLITFFKLWTKDMMRNVVDWHITISEGTIPVDENEGNLSKLRCFEDCKVTHENDPMTNIPIYYIKNEPIEDDGSDEEPFLVVDLGDRHFNNHIFGFSQNIPVNFKAKLSDILKTFLSLEKYIDAPKDDIPFGVQPKVNLEVSLEEALYYPRRISDRIPVVPEYNCQITPINMKVMWSRLVAHYFEYLFGVPQIKQLGDADKVSFKGVEVSNRKSVLFSTIYVVWLCGRYAGMERGLLLGGGIVYIPTRTTDEELIPFYVDLECVTQTLIIKELRRLRFSQEEYVLTKLVCLFSDTDKMKLSPGGRVLCEDSHKRFLFMLMECIKTKYRSMKHEDVVGRLQTILSLFPHLDMVNEVAERHLNSLVQRGKVSVRGQLPTEIHVLSKQ